MTFLFDVEVVSLEVVLLEVWYIVTDEDIHHGFELDIEDSVECGLSVGCHDDCVNEGFFDLVSLFLLIFAAPEFFFFRNELTRFSKYVPSFVVGKPIKHITTFSAKSSTNN